MSSVLIGVVVLAFLFILMFSGVPIGFAMALMGFLGFMFIGGIKAALTMVGIVPFASVASYIFSVLPLFLLMGEFASSSGLMRDSYRALNTWLGHLPGGLAMATVGGCASFAAVSGSSVATAATTSRVCLPEMMKYKYDPRLATGTIAAGGTLGILIPPSMGFIVYGLITDTSVGKLFMAGIIPGVLEALFYIATIYILCKINPLMGPAVPRANWRSRIISVKDISGLIIIFVLVMGGIWGGIFTPTEAAAVGTLIAFIFALVRRRLNRQNLKASFKGAAGTTGMVLGMLVGAMIFASFVTVTGIPRELAAYVAGLSVPPLGILVAFLIVYLFLGCIMDAPSMILITMPIFFPVVLSLGFDPVWFGVLSTRMVEIAMITPPIGLNVFIIKGMTKDIPMYTIFKGIFPFLIADICHVAILVAFPQISLFLPNTMMASK